MIPALIGAGASILGGILASKSAKSQQEDNYEAQKEFAQQGIRWKVADAQAAGVHPLFALGGNTASYSPSPIVAGDYGLGAAGQDIGRAIAAGSTQEERQEEKYPSPEASHSRLVQEQLPRLQLERAHLENELLRSRIARENSAQLGPPIPTTVDQGPLGSQGDIARRYGVPTAARPPGRIIVKPQEVTVDPANPTMEPGSVPEVGYLRTPTGYAPVPSKDAKERIEDMAIPELLWAYRNNFLPSFGKSRNPPPIPLPYDWEWDYSISRQEYYPRAKPSRIGWRGALPPRR